MSSNVIKRPSLFDTSNMASYLDKKRKEESRYKVQVMSKILATIILLAICVALILGAVFPLANEIKETTAKAFNAVKNFSNNIAETP